MLISVHAITWQLVTLILKYRYQNPDTASNVTPFSCYHMAVAASNLTPVCCLNNTNWEFIAVAYNPYSQIYFTRGLKSIQCWNQCLKYYSSSTFKLRHNLRNFTTFLVEILPHTRYGVRDVASMLLIMVQLEKFYTMHPLQYYITGTWLNPMMSKFTENQC